MPRSRLEIQFTRRTAMIKKIFNKHRNHRDAQDYSHGPTLESRIIRKRNRTYIKDMTGCANCAFLDRHFSDAYRI